MRDLFKAIGGFISNQRELMKLEAEEAIRRDSSTEGVTMPDSTKAHVPAFGTWQVLTNSETDMSRAVTIVLQVAKDSATKKRISRDKSKRSTVNLFYGAANSGGWIKAAMVGVAQGWADEPADPQGDFGGFMINSRQTVDGALVNVVASAPFGMLDFNVLSRMAAKLPADKTGQLIIRCVPLAGFFADPTHESELFRLGVLSEKKWTDHEGTKRHDVFARVKVHTWTLIDDKHPLWVPFSHETEIEGGSQLVNMLKHVRGEATRKDVVSLDLTSHSQWVLDLAVREAARPKISANLDKAVEDKPTDPSVPTREEFAAAKAAVDASLSEDEAEDDGESLYQA